MKSKNTSYLKLEFDQNVALIASLPKVLLYNPPASVWLLISVNLYLRNFLLFLFSQILYEAE